MFAFLIKVQLVARTRPKSRAHLEGARRVRYLKRGFSVGCTFSPPLGRERDIEKGACDRGNMGAPAVRGNGVPRQGFSRFSRNL